MGRTDAEAEAPILQPPDGKSRLTGKDSDAGKDWRQEEKGTTEYEMAGWHNDSMGMSLSKLRETVKDRESWLQPMGLQRVGHKWANYNKLKNVHWGMGAKPLPTSSGNQWCSSWSLKAVKPLGKRLMRNFKQIDQIQNTYIWNWVFLKLSFPAVYD